MNARKLMPVLLVVLGLAVGALTTMSGAQSRRAAAPIFADLRVGESVRVQDLGTVYQIGVYPSRTSGPLKIVDLTADCLVIEDTAKRRTRIPVHSIKCVTTPRR